MRRDALANRTRLLEAAHTLVAARGLNVPLEEIAREAGVGIATLYRHYPSRDALLQALIDERVARFTALVERALEAEDAWEGFRGFLEEALESQARDRAIAEALMTRYDDRPSLDQARAHAADLLQELIERAQAQGRLRPDVGISDVTMLFWAHRRICELTAEVAPDTWRRHLALALDAFSASNGTPLPGTPLTREQLRRAVDSQRARRA